MISIINKSKLYRKKINKPNDQNINNYKLYSNIFNKLKKTAKAKYYTDMLDIHKHSIKETWAVLRQVMNKNKQSVKLPSVFIVNGVEMSNSKRIAEELNTFFSEIGTKTSNSISETTQNFSNYLKGNHTTIFFMHPTDIHEVKLVTQKLKNKKTTSCDDLSTYIIQKTIEEISIPITHIINQSLYSGLVPDKLKISKIIPIFKYGNNKHFNNYRPISILPPISKILEKIVCNRLMHFLDKYDVLYRHQYGFRQKHSTIHPILQLLKDIADANDKTTRDVTLSVFLDLLKAFDTINHDILLKKFHFYGIRGVPNSWFANYLSNRKQFTEINNCKSALTNVSTGVPQGSILGSILFLLYINDINNCTLLNLLSFADDTTIYRSGPYNKELFDEVNYELIKIHMWLCTNKLSLNVKKSKACIFSPPNSRYTLGNNCLSLNDIKINFIGENDESIKFLGLHLDEHLTWKNHIAAITSKISKSLFAINRVKYLLPHYALKTLYFSLVQSHIQYGIQAWGNASNISKITVLQKRAIRIINQINYRGHTDPLFKSERILKLTDLYKLHVSLFMFDLQSGSLPTSFNLFIPRSDNNVTCTITKRQHDNIQRLRPRTTFSSKLPKHNFIKIWNNIDELIRNQKSRNLFKRTLTKQFTAQYKTNVKCINRRCRDCYNNA